MSSLLTAITMSSSINRTCIMVLSHLRLMNRAVTARRIAKKVFLSS
jgi:hypothetical protein